MASLLGLAAYSDDEEEETVQSTTMAVDAVASSAGTSSGPAVPTPTGSILVGLSAYADSDEEEEDNESQMNDDTITTPNAAAAATSVPALPSPARIPVQAMRPSASMDDVATSARSSSSVASSTAATATALPHSSSLNDCSSSSAYSSVDFIPPPTAEEMATLPPLPTTSLPIALAQRHEANLTRQRMQAANTRALPLVAALIANKAFHNPYILRRVASQLDIQDYGSNLHTDYWREQNLPDGQEEDDYIAIQKQAEAAVSWNIEIHSFCNHCNEV